MGFHNRALGKWSIFRGPVNTNPLTHAVSFGWNTCELVHVRRCVICLVQPAVSLRAEWAWLFEGGWRWMGGRAGANPPVPRAMCPAPSQLHHAASSVVGPLERYKALWMLSAQTTHCPPSRDYSSLNEAARRRIQSKRRRRRRRRYTILQQELHSLKGRGHWQSWHANQQRLGNHPMRTTRPARRIGRREERFRKDPSLFKSSLGPLGTP